MDGLSPHVAPAYRAAGRPCSREAFYALACDPARSVVVEACAGAGKTWLLVSRILRALLAGTPPQEILAITFTRKAAGEMRARLAEWLQLFAFATPDERVAELRKRGLDAAAARAAEPALAALQAQVLASGRTVEINTFHAWFSQLMRAAPREMLNALGLHSGMALIEDIEELRPELMRRFHARVAASAPALADFTALLTRYGRSRLGDWLAAALNQRTEIELAAEEGSLAGAIEPAAARWPRHGGWADVALQAALAAAAAALGAQKNKLPRDAAAALRNAFELDDPEAAFRAAWSALFTQDDEPRKLGDLPELPPALDALRGLERYRAQQQAHDDHGRMVGLCGLLLAEWRALKRERSLADMPDLERCALALLRDPALSGALQQRLDARVRHLLIDEFQDTSPLQWQALLEWLSAYAGAGSAPSIFIVGDPKQSIYRFRRAEPRVFQAARVFVEQALQGVVLECDHSWRPAPGITALLNSVFGTAAREGRFDGFRPHSTEAAPAAGPALAALPSTPRPPRDAASKQAPVWRDTLTTPRREPEAVRRGLEAAQVAAAICQLVAEQGVAPGRIMVLARTHAVLAHAAQALRERDLPCAASAELPLASLPEAGDLIALLDVLASPSHDLSLAVALKSPIFGAGDADLLALAQRAAQGPRQWLATLRQWSDAPPALRRARGLIEGWLAPSRILPPHDLLDRIVHEADALARIVAAAPPDRRGLARLAVEALLAQALALDGGRYATPYGFVRALRNRPIEVPVQPGADAVQLLTLHAAKGLEADIVFLLDTEPEQRTDSDPAVMVDWPVGRAAPQRVAFVAHRHRVPPSLEALAEAEAGFDAREELNLLYVALTRARQRIAISRTEPQSAGAGRSWWSRLEALARPWQPDLQRRAAAALALPQVPVLPDASLLVPPSAGKAPAFDDPAARLGQALHRALEWATGPAATPGAIADLVQAAAREFGLDAQQLAQLRDSVERVLGSAELAPFFDAANLAWAGNEVPLADGGQVLRIDRLVLRIDDGAWWVLDYKLGATPEQVAVHRTQLARYRDAVVALHPGVLVRAAFISGQARLVPLAAEG